MILKGSAEMKDAFSGRLNSESMWAVLGQVPLKQSLRQGFKFT